MFGKSSYNYSKIINNHKNEEIVFYSEGRHHSEHLFPIAKEILKRKKILYVTSDDSDPAIFYKHHNLTSFFIGSSVFRTLFFENVSCKLFVTSLPDLNKYSFKKSRHCPYYIYVHHSIVSSHMAYRESAFDAFNEVFCVGPHHIEELSLQEKNSDIQKKVLTPHGNAKIDMLLSARDIGVTQNSILIAPSWGPAGLFENHLEEILDICQKNREFLFILRPHSETIRKSKHVDKILRTLKASNIIYDQSTSNEWLFKSEIMISDWSGVAYEFILGLRRPVIFVNTQKKINNENYTSLGIEPFEVSKRNKLGIVVSLEELQQISSLIDRAREMSLTLNKREHEYIYNLGKSALTASNIIYQRIGYAPEDLRKKLKETYDQFHVRRTKETESLICIVENSILQIRHNSFDENFIAELIKKIDVAKKLYDTYDLSWRKSDKARKLDKEEILIICFYFLTSFDNLISKNKELALKVSNSLLNISEFDESIKEEYLDYFKKIILNGLQ